MLIPAALLISSVGFIFFYWSVKSDQYEDMDGEAYRILMDDDDQMIPGKAKQANAGQVKDKDKERPGNGAGG